MIATPEALSVIKPHLSVIPGRWPQVKLHTGLRTAKAALTYKCGYRGAYSDMEIHEYVDGEWRLVYEVAKGTDTDALPWKVNK